MVRIFVTFSLIIFAGAAEAGRLYKCIGPDGATSPRF